MYSRKVKHKNRVNELFKIGEIDKGAYQKNKYIKRYKEW